MITKFKIFENDISKYDIEDIEYRLRLEFYSEEEFEEWCCKADNKDDFDEVDLSIVSQYDVPVLLDLKPNDQKLTEIIVELLSKIDFDEYFEPRDGSYDDWLAKNDSKKYNL